GVDIVLRLSPLGRPATETVAPIESSLPPPATSEGTAAPAATPAPATVIQAPATSPADARITITLNEIPLGEALRYIASQAGLKVKVEPYAVSVIPITEQSNDLITKQYRVPPGFISTGVLPGTSLLQRGAYKTAQST